ENSGEKSDKFTSEKSNESGEFPSEKFGEKSDKFASEKSEVFTSEKSGEHQRNQPVTLKVYAGERASKPARYDHRKVQRKRQRKVARSPAKSSGEPDDRAKVICQTSASIFTGNRSQTAFRSNTVHRSSTPLAKSQGKIMSIAGS